jgi:gamma-D-glutamyl-L-lysine dipeptidyl-peptidase
MQLAICHFSQANVMSKASHHSELETQLLFGEVVKIVCTMHQWASIITQWDAYDGWVLKSQLTIIDTQPSMQFLQECCPGFLRLGAQSILLPAGASLPNLKNKNVQIGDHSFQLLSNAIEPKLFQFSEKNILQIVLSYLHVPYMWGGKTHSGIDCSGFSAMLYKFFNVSLKHDASWQSKHGEVLDFLQNAACGDLAFFDDAEGNITHVGILLNNAEIIHATETAGGVTIDAIDTAGIISRISGKRTHNLRVVKRYLKIVKD